MNLDLIGYGAFFMTMALTYAIICLGLNVQWGQTGLFNVGVAGFVAIGAYVSALLTTPETPGRFGGFGLPIIVGWIGGGAAAGLFQLPRRRADHPVARRLSGDRHVRRRGRRPPLSFEFGAPDRRSVRRRVHPSPLCGARPRAVAVQPDEPRASSPSVVFASSISRSNDCCVAPGAECCSAIPRG